LPNKKSRQYAAQVQAGWIDDDGDEGMVSALDAAEEQLEQRMWQLGISLGLKGLL
jgi:hypothetical protein